ITEHWSILTQGDFFSGEQSREILILGSENGASRQGTSGGTISEFVMSSRLEGEPETVLNLAPSVLARLRGETEILTRIECCIDDGGGAQSLRSGTVGTCEST